MKSHPRSAAGASRPHGPQSKGGSADSVRPYVAPWRSLSGQNVHDLVGQVRALMQAASPSGNGNGRARRPILHVGTDSKHRGYHTDYVTVAAIVSPGHGGRVFYQRRREARSPSLSHRLFLETELSLRIACELEKAGIRDIVVHVDANVDVRHRSARYVQALSGMVVGYGFEVRVKPDSWCATHVADFVVNDRHQRVA